ncbi:hypothetical protein WDV76_11300 [Xenorhabdus griffiniae]|uniref:hypothetical protein n=1 Tax=Xenorhabdus griffiniae TaxID=351672 RepID=UPI0030D0F076
MKFFLKRLQTIFLLSFTLPASAVQSYVTFNENDPVNNRAASFIQQNQINTQKQPSSYSVPYNYNCGEQINYGVFDPNGSFRYRILKNDAQIDSVTNFLNPPIFMRSNAIQELRNIYEYSNTNDPYANIFIDRYMTRLSDDERRPTLAMVDYGRDHSPPLSHTEKNSSSLQCNDFIIVYPLAENLMPIINILLTGSEPKIKKCEVELNTTKTWALSSWYSTFTRKDDCQVNIRLICDGNENACSPSTGDYSTRNKFQLIIYDDEKNYKQESIERVKNTGKVNVPYRSSNLESTDNMKFENKGSGTTKISYVTSSCYSDTGPSKFEIKPNLDRAFTIKNKNTLSLSWWNCYNQDKKISWKIEYITYE